ncbi:MAG: riboflavin synthase [Bacillota bacterium]
MFTGIVEELGRLQSRQGSREGVDLTISARLILEDLKIGDSVAVNGVCLTAVQTGRDSFTAQVMPETLRKTDLIALLPGQHVNLERALALGGRLGGHLVSGHIDGTGTLERRRTEGNALIIHFRAPPEILRYVISKGSIAVDGISLTVAGVDQDGFSVSLIPHTAAETTLGRKQPGAMVNLECDLIGKYVEKLLQPHTAGGRPAERSITTAFLQEKGFI